MELLSSAVRRQNVAALPSPAEVVATTGVRETDVQHVVLAARAAIAASLEGRSDRLVVVVGPCSIHATDAALEYASRLIAERRRFAGQLEIVMRVYFEKPRTTIGWKGLINDPYLDGSCRIENGLKIARALLHDINAMQLPVATEFLDPFTPAYVADLIAWGAIGARTTESQTHREMASGLPMPVGFKNGTDGNLQIAADAIRAANRAHHYISIDSHGLISAVASPGNPHAHVVLRGGKQPNYDAASVRAAHDLLGGANILPRLFIDASHANSSRQYRNQVPVCADIGAQIAAGNRDIAGVMIESHLLEGRQDHIQGQPLEYGKSITDACLSWEDTVGVLEQLAASVSKRRAMHAAAPDALALA